jgi:hydroxyacylglutathione hydrolase
MLHNDRQALEVDLGDACPVLDAMQRLGATLEAILVTHHHTDRTGGVDELRARTGCKAFGPENEPMPEPLPPLSGGERIHALGLYFQVLEVPSHTSGHLAYYCQQVNEPHLLFCDNTQLGGDCIRMFEGPSVQTLKSLNRRSTLTDTTLICGYTPSSLKFAVVVDPGSAHLTEYRTVCQARRINLCPAHPSTLRTKRRSNHFLRTR